MPLKINSINFERIYYGPQEGQWKCKVTVGDISLKVHEMTFSPSNPKALIDLLVPDIVSELCNVSEEAYQSLYASIHNPDKFKEIGK